jgi:hypothetical protein
MAEYAVRFFLGGAVVSIFAVLGDALRPKSFAGLFGAAPSVALATLGITLFQHGSSYAAVQSRAMTLGALALAAYSVAVCQLLMRTRIAALPATLLAFVLWLAAALCFHFLVFGGA